MSISIEHDEFIEVKTGAGNVRQLQRGANKGKWLIVSGSFRNLIGERTRLVDQGHNVIVYVRPGAATKHQKRLDDLFVAMGRLDGRAQNLAREYPEGSQHRKALDAVAVKLEEAWRLLSDPGLVK
jgi:hypothetical protein